MPHVNYHTDRVPVYAELAIAPDRGILIVGRRLADGLPVCQAVVSFSAWSDGKEALAEMGRAITGLAAAILDNNVLN